MNFDEDRFVSGKFSTPTTGALLRKEQSYAAFANSPRPNRWLEQQNALANIYQNIGRLGHRLDRVEFDLLMNLKGNWRAIARAGQLFPAYARAQFKYDVELHLEPPLKEQMAETIKMMHVNKYLTIQMKKGKDALIDTGALFKDGRMRGHFFTKGAGHVFGDVTYCFGIAKVAPIYPRQARPWLEGRGQSNFKHQAELAAWLHGGKDLNNPRPVVYALTKRQQKMWEWVYWNYLALHGRATPRTKEQKESLKRTRMILSGLIEGMPKKRKSGTEAGKMYRADELAAMTVFVGGRLHGVPGKSGFFMMRPRPFFLRTFMKLRGYMLRVVSDAVQKASIQAFIRYGSGPRPDYMPAVHGDGLTGAATSKQKPPEAFSMKMAI